MLTEKVITRIKGIQDSDELSNVINDQKWPIDSFYAKTSICTAKGLNGIVFQELMIRKHNVDISSFDKIQPTQRPANLKGTFDPNRGNDKTGTSEKLQCKELLHSSNDSFVLGKIYDREVPLRCPKKYIVGNCNVYGDIDLFSVFNGDIMVIEYKISKSSEPLLRAVSEIITYFFRINGPNPKCSNYKAEFEKVFKTKCNKIVPAVVVPRSILKDGHKLAYELIKKYGIRCYTFKDLNDYKQIEYVDEKTMAEYEKAAYEKYKDNVYNVSEEIIAEFNK